MAMPIKAKKDLVISSFTWFLEVSLTLIEYYNRII